MDPIQLGASILAELTNEASCETHKIDNYEAESTRAAYTINGPYKASIISRLISAYETCIDKIQVKKEKRER